MLIQTNRGLTCPERTCNELHYYEPNDALNSYEDFTTELFCCVDDKLSQHGKNRKHSQAKL